jgi:Glycosyltransferase family 87
MISSINSNPWLTARRLRAHGLILAFCLWSVYLWNISSPGLRDRAGNLKGTDFLHFYTLGSLALAHSGADLYNLRAQSELAKTRLATAAGLDYLPLYPPQVSIFFAPLATLTFVRALVMWLGLTALIYFLCGYALWRACPNLRNQGSTVLILGSAFPAFWHLIAWGQTSALVLACFTLAFFALRPRHEFLAGLAFGCLIFKPQLALAAAVVLIFTLHWRIIAGALVSSFIELLVAWLYYGPAPLLSWVHTLLTVREQLAWLEPRPYQTHCLRTFWSMLIPWPTVSLVLYLVSAVFVGLLAIRLWRSRASLELRFSGLLFATVLLAPHLTVYDLVILAPAFFLLSDWLMAHPSPSPANLGLLLYLAFVLPLLGPLARWTHFQLSVPIMAAILYVIRSYGRRSVSPTTLS